MQFEYLLVPQIWQQMIKVSVQISPFDNFDSFLSVLHVPLHYSSLKIEALNFSPSPADWNFVVPFDVNSNKNIFL